MHIAGKEIVSLQIQVLVLLLTQVECCPAVALDSLHLVVVIVDVGRIHFEVAKGILFEETRLHCGAILTLLVVVHLN